MDRHQADVIIISRRLASLYTLKEPYQTSSSSLPTPTKRNPKTPPTATISTNHLTHILKINKSTRTCLVEPHVPISTLLRTLLPHALVPPVVPELPLSTTVGAAYSRTAAAASSFKHGFFDATVSWAEFVLPDGRVVGASATERPDLFRGAPGSHGSLGTVPTCFELRLVPAVPYVEVTMTPCDSAARTLGAVDDAAEDARWDFVDGIVMAKDRGVLVTGRVVETISATASVVRLSRAWYSHVERATRKLPAAQPLVEVLPLEDFLFRYGRAASWSSALPFGRLARWMAGDVLKPRRMYDLFEKAGVAEQYIVQDLALPASRAQQMIEYLDDDFGIYPLWLCPLQAPEHKSMNPHPRPAAGMEVSEEPMMNIGVCGPGPTGFGKFVEANRRLEAKVGELGGMKWLYGKVFYTEEEFWGYFDRAWYEGLRRKYKADHLPSLYERVRTRLPDEEMGGGKQAAPIVRQLSKKVAAVGPKKAMEGAASILSQKNYLLTGSKS